MSSFSPSTLLSRPILRSAGMAALLGSAMIAAPLGMAFAKSPLQVAQATTPQAGAAPMGSAPMGAAPMSAETKADTVEQRITSLHSALAITAAEEPDWTNVAQAMRDNAAAMQTLIDAKTARAPADMTAVDDLNLYAKFAEAHVAGLKKLTSAFDVLYESMPAAQKKIADAVFARSRHEHAKNSG